MSCTIFGFRLSKEPIQSSTSECNAFVRAFIECIHFVMKEITTAKGDITALKIILQDQVQEIGETSVFFQIRKKMP